MILSTASLESQFVALIGLFVSSFGFGFLLILAVIHNVEQQSAHGLLSLIGTSKIFLNEVDAHDAVNILAEGMGSLDASGCSTINHATNAEIVAFVGAMISLEISLYHLFKDIDIGKSLRSLDFCPIHRPARGLVGFLYGIVVATVCTGINTLAQPFQPLLFPTFNLLFALMLFASLPAIGMLIGLAWLDPAERLPTDSPTCLEAGQGSMPRYCCCRCLLAAACKNKNPEEPTPGMKSAAVVHLKK